nr:hypothetical protein [Lentzea waywayandensis]
MLLETRSERLHPHRRGLLLGAHDPDTGDLVYIGDVGTSFTRQERDHLRDRLQPLERPGHPFASHRSVRMSPVPVG